MKLSSRQLMQTKKQELATLKTTLKTHTTDKANKGKTLADGKVELEDTLNQLEADETFFTDTKQNCAGKASEWAQRTRMRTEELAGINHAVAILSSDEAKEIFQNASTTFVQLAEEVAPSKGRQHTYNELKRLASQYSNLEIAQIAVRVKSGTKGHFDEIMTIIDNMITRLREEEKQDIQERDWCEAKQGKNKNDMEDLNKDITKAGDAVTRMGDEVTALDTKLTELETAINQTKTDKQDLLDMRNTEEAAFRQGVKDDTKAIELLEQAIRHMARYYGEAAASSLAQSSMENDTAPPEVAWRGTYNKRGGEGRGVVAILTMIRDNLEKEIGAARQADADAQVNYESDRKSLNDMLRAQEKSEVELEKVKADLGLKIADKEEEKRLKGEDLTAETDKKTALDTNCAWVASHFDSRRTKRKNEINGLIDAKNYLAGVDEGF